LFAGVRGNGRPPARPMILNIVHDGRRHRHRQMAARAPRPVARSIHWRPGTLPARRGACQYTRAERTAARLRQRRTVQGLVARIEYRQWRHFVRRRWVMPRCDVIAAGCQYPRRRAPPYSQDCGEDRDGRMNPRTGMRSHHVELHETESLVEPTALST
jgi:hypothetical protein